MFIKKKDRLLKKKRLHNLWVYSTQLSKEVPIDICLKKTVTTEMWVTFALSLQKTLYVVAMHVNITFSSSSHKKCVLYKKSPHYSNFPTGFLYSLL